MESHRFALNEYSASRFTFSTKMPTAYLICCLQPLALAAQVILREWHELLHLPVLLPLRIKQP